MNWTVWILLSALFLALYDLAKKASVRENAVLPVLLCSTCCGCAAFVDWFDSRTRKKFASALNLIMWQSL